MPRMSNRAIKKYTKKDGQTYYKFQTYLGKDETGKSIFVTRQGFTSYSEANDVFEKLRAKGTQGYVHKKQIKLSKVWQLWFANHMRQVKESSANKTQQVYRNHIAPYFANQYVDQIRIPALQNWINNKANEIVKYRDAFNILNNLFKYAQIMDYLKNNPLDRIIVPKKTTRPRRNIGNNYYDSQAELNEFLKAAKKQGIRKYAFFKLLSSTGLRKGEALALKWSDIDFNKHLIHVTKTLTQGFEDKLIIQSPKTKNSLRDVPLSNSLAKVLVDYRKQSKIIYPLIFCKVNGNYLNLSAPSNWLHYIYKDNPKLKRITVHGFRHTFATLMLQPGTGNTPKDVQMILGHENVQMTLDIYTHESAKGKRNALRSINMIGL